MKLLIEDGLQTVDRPTGIGRYSLLLRQSLCDYVRRSPEIDIAVGYNRHSFLRRCPNRLLRRLLYLGWLNSAAEPLFRAQGADVVHYTAQYIGFGGKHNPKVVFTLHDLCALKVPDTLPPAYLRFSRKVTEQAVRKADVIITPTVAVKKEILECFPFADERRIVTCYHGLSLPDGTTTLKGGSNDQRYFLHVGTLERRKNLGALISAFARFKRKDGRAHTKLVLVGKRGYAFEEIEEAIRREQIGDHLSICGYVSQSLLERLYRSALALVAPSLYEGFGIPLVESMKYGTPIIASDIPVFREVAGDAAFYYGKPTDVDSLAGALRRIYDDETARADFAQKCVQRSRLFTPENMARTHLSAYMKAFES